MSGLADPDDVVHLSTTALALSVGSAGDHVGDDDGSVDLDGDHLR